MMFGYPGAGKTTAAKAIATITGAVHLSSDELRLKLFKPPTFSLTEHAKLYAQLNIQTKKLLSRGHDVIYDANLNRYQHRQEKYTIARIINAKPILIWVKTPKELAKQRALDEIRKPLWPTHETPNHMFERIASIIEPPQEDEPYISLDGTQISQAYIKEKLGL